MQYFLGLSLASLSESEQLKGAEEKHGDRDQFPKFVL
jgi:hypothetical protein